jgi:hypothetical protein
MRKTLFVSTSIRCLKNLKGLEVITGQKDPDSEPPKKKKMMKSTSQLAMAGAKMSGGVNTTTNEKVYSIMGRDRS